MDRRTLPHRVGELVGWGAVAGVGVVMLTQTFGIDGNRLVASVQALTPYGLVLMVVVAAIALWQQILPLALTAAVVGVSVLGLATPIAFPPGQAIPAADATEVRVAAVNLLFSNPRINDVADLMIETNADVLVFSEYTVDHSRALLAHPLASLYPFQVNRDGLFAGGTAVWSRLPIVENARPVSINRTIDATVTTADGPIRVLAVHPPTPIFDFGEWKADLKRIGQAAESATEPIVVIGDFNASYWNPALRRLLRNGLTDAHMANGAGWSVSWPTDKIVPPFVRLDHALTGNGLVSTSVEDYRVPGSDHAGLTVTVALATP
ncbi:MAG: endonuclease/exonuclease/phosphatase family protein [Ilumatobacter sp.]